MIKKPYIVFVLPTLTAGGAERIVSFLSQNIDQGKFQSKLLIAGYSTDSAYMVEKVDSIYLNKSRVLFSIPSIISFIRREKPDIVFSSISHLNISMALVSFLFKKTKFIGREATIQSAYKDIGISTRSMFNPYSYLSKILYSKLDMVVCQSKDMAEEMINNYSVPKARTIIINNPVSFLPPLKDKFENNNYEKNVFRLITIGRLSKEKGILRLIQILAKLNFEFTYTLIGNGEEKQIIFKEAEKLGIVDKINHVPFTNDVHSYLASHDLFLQGSYVEGFPNALLESCMVGTPVIAFDVPGGTKEIIENGINGFMVNTEEEYIRCLHQKMEWDPLKIRESVQSKFNMEKILGEYEKLFFKILGL